MSDSVRKYCFVEYETGKTVRRDGKTYPEKKLLRVGSVFLSESEAGGKFVGQGKMLCPHCGAVNLFPGFTEMKAYVCRECGKGVNITP